VEECAARIADSGHFYENISIERFEEAVRGLPGICFNNNHNIFNSHQLALSINPALIPRRSLSQIPQKARTEELAAIIFGQIPFFPVPINPGMIFPGVTTISRPSPLPLEGNRVASSANIAETEGALETTTAVASKAIEKA